MIRQVYALMLFSLVGFFIGFCALFPSVSLLYNGFAVDAEGLVYVAEKTWIGVYDGGESVREIQVGHATKMSGYYEFTIREDRLFLRGTNGMRYIMDLEGNVLSEERDLFPRLSDAERFAFTGADGARYVLENRLVGRVRIVRTGADGAESVVFRMPVGCFLLRSAMPLYFTAGAFWVLSDKYRAWKRQQNKTNRPPGF